MFPWYFPDGCPPTGAVQQHRMMCRFLKKKGDMTDDDFKSYYELHGKEKYEKNFLMKRKYTFVGLGYL